MDIIRNLKKMQGFAIAMAFLVTIDFAIFRLPVYDLFLTKITKTASNSPLTFLKLKRQASVDTKPEIVFLGDSRTLCSIDPRQININKRVFNFSIRNAKVSDFYYIITRYKTSVFSQTRVVVVGLSLFNFNDNLNSSYTPELTPSLYDRFISKRPSALLGYFFKMADYFPVNFFRFIDYKKAFSSILVAGKADRYGKPELDFKQSLGFEPNNAGKYSGGPIADYPLLKSFSEPSMAANEDLKYFFAMIKDNGDIKFIVYFNPVADNFAKLYRGKYKRQYDFIRNSINEGQGKYGYLFIEDDINKKSGITDSDFNSDGHHLNGAGAQKLSIEMAREISKYMNKPLGENKI